MKPDAERQGLIAKVRHAKAQGQAVLFQMNLLVRLEGIGTMGGLLPDQVLLKRIAGLFRQIPGIQPAVAMQNKRFVGVGLKCEALPPEGEAIAGDPISEGHEGKTGCLPLWSTGSLQDRRASPRGLDN